MTSFIYLVQVISAADDDWLVVVRNLSWARAVCRRMTRILSREEVALRVSGYLFNAVIQAVLLFGLETWMVTPRMGKALEEFQSQVERRLTGRIPRRTPKGKWTYTSVVTAQEETEFFEMEEYIRRVQNKVTQ